MANSQALRVQNNTTGLLWEARTTATGGATGLKPGQEGVASWGNSDKATIWLHPSAGSFKYTIWRCNAATGIWAAGAKSAAVTANTAVDLTRYGESLLFVELSDFAGNCAATAYAIGNTTSPGQG